jgi:quinate dehydrogenase
VADFLYEGILGLAVSISHISIFKNEGLIGSTVTMANKINEMKLVDVLHEVGEGFGSINAIYTRIDPETKKAVRIGTNTNTVGIS